MHSSKNNCFFIILPRSFFLNIGASNFYLDGSLKCNKNIYKIKDIWMRRVIVYYIPGRKVFPFMSREQ
jgi:hypothetical protein